MSCNEGHCELCSQIQETKLGKISCNLVHWRVIPQSGAVFGLIQLLFFVIYYFDLHFISFLGVSLFFGILFKIIFPFVEKKLPLSKFLGDITTVTLVDISELLTVIANFNLTLFWKVAVFDDPLLSVAAIIGTLIGSYIVGFFSDFTLIYIVVLGLFTIPRALEHPVAAKQVSVATAKLSGVWKIVESKIPQSISKKQQ